MKGVAAFFIFLFIIPIGHLLTIGALKATPSGQISIVLLGLSVAFILMYATKFLRSEGWETFTGILAGVVLWACLFEIGFRLGVKTFGVDETKAIELTLVPIVPLFLYLLFNENIKCTFFAGIRRLLQTEREPLQEVRVDRWAPRTAFKVFAVMWIGHVVLYYAYDERIFGVMGLFTKVFFAFCLGTGGYLACRLVKAREMGFALRFAIPTVVIVWSCVETIGRWRDAPDPAAALDPLCITAAAFALVLSALFIFIAEKRSP